MPKIAWCHFNMQYLYDTKYTLVIGTLLFLPPKNLICRRFVRIDHTHTQSLFVYTIHVLKCCALNGSPTHVRHNSHFITEATKIFIKFTSKDVGYAKK